MNEHLRDTLQDLADMFGTRPVSDRAAELWKKSLADIDQGEVIAALEDWAKHKSKMPIPADIRKAVADRVSYRIEEQARRNREDAEQSEPMTKGADPATLRALKKWRAAHERAKGVIPQNFWLIQAVAEYDGKPPFCKRIIEQAFHKVPSDAEIAQAKAEARRIKDEYDRILPNLGELIRWEHNHGLPEAQPVPWMNADRNHSPAVDDECPF